MPAPPKTSDEEIVEAARRLLECKGVDGLSMAEVARRVGIRTPSLYGRFADRAELLYRVELMLFRRLAGAVAAAVAVADARQALKAAAHAYRAFAKANPNGYMLMMSARARHSEEGTAARAAALAPCLRPIVALVGEKDALLAARVITPFMHGFVSMELAQAFRLGGGLDEAFEFGLDTILNGLSGRGA